VPGDDDRHPSRTSDPAIAFLMPAVEPINAGLEAAHILETLWTGF
jgi:hypothetical protein